MFDSNKIAFLKSLSILYLEDEEEIQKQLAESFKRKFGRVYLASNGIEGLELYQNHKPNIIVTDLKMPHMDGLSFIKLIRDKDEVVPIIVITAYGELMNLKKSLELKVDRFIQKPTTMNDLDYALEKATESIIQQKAIEEYQELFKAIMGSHDEYSIVANVESVLFISLSLLNLIIPIDKNKFIEQHDSFTWKAQNSGETSLIQFDCPEKLFQSLINSENALLTLDINKNENINFKVKIQHFQDKDLYYVSFTIL